MSLALLCRGKLEKNRVSVSSGELTIDNHLEVNRGRGRVSNITLIILIVSLKRGRLSIYKNNENEPGLNCQIFVMLN